VPRKVAAVSVTVNVEPTDKYAAPSISSTLIADDDPSLNTADPLVGTYNSPLTACNTQVNPLPHGDANRHTISKRKK